MKKSFFLLSTLMLVSSLFFPGCQKSITEPTEEEVSTNKSKDDHDKKGCRLTYAVDWNSNPNWFRYNHKGVVDEWQIDFGTGINDIFTMEYDHRNRLSHAEWHFDGELIATIEFVWTGKYITEEHWNYGGFLFDGWLTWNRKGELIKTETSYGAKAEMVYSDGSPIRVYQYLDDELIGLDILTYKQPNKNPFLAIPGLTYGFPYGNFVFGERLETSDKYIVYEGGVPTVILDTDPKKTVMHLGRQHYPSSVTFFDRVSNSYMTRNYEYRNCGREDHSSTNMINVPLPQEASAAKKISSRYQLKPRSKEELMKRIEELRKSHSNK